MKLRAWKPFMTTGRINHDITRLELLKQPFPSASPLFSLVTLWLTLLTRPLTLFLNDDPRLSLSSWPWPSSTQPPPPGLAPPSLIFRPLLLLRLSRLLQQRHKNMRTEYKFTAQWEFPLNWHVKNYVKCLTLLWGSLFVLHPRWPQAACPPRRSHRRCTESISRQRSHHLT